MTKTLKYLYGEYSVEQMEDHKKYLHSSIHWLLIYKDPKTSYQWRNVNVDKYLDMLLRKIAGLNVLFGCPQSIVTLMSVLEAARIELHSEDFEWAVYRKLILDAQNLVDTLPDETVEWG